MVSKIGIYHDPRKTKPWVCRWFGWPDIRTGIKRRYSKSFRLKSEAERFARRC